MYSVMETDVIFDCMIHIHLPEIYQQFYMISQITGQPVNADIKSHLKKNLEEL